jgi:hypothetical protein
MEPTSTYIKPNSEKSSSCHDIFSMTESGLKLSCSEDFRKFQSDSTSIVSDSSEGYCESSDSDTHSMRNFNMKKASNFDSEYPKMRGPRSKSQMFKKRYTESVVVNEEKVEDENEIEHPVRRKPLNFSTASYNDDLPSKFKKSSKSKSLSNSASQPSFKTRFEKMDNVDILTMNFDPVVEDREEERDANQKQLLGLNSPRVLFMTDFTEDTGIHPWNVANLHVHRDYALDTSEVIAEDNNENNVEEVRRKPKEFLHKSVLDDIIDREEIIISKMHELNVNSENLDFETINEANVEDEDKDNQPKLLKHNKSSKCKLNE